VHFDRYIFCINILSHVLISVPDLFVSLRVRTSGQMEVEKMKKMAIGIGIILLIALAMPAFAISDNAALVIKDTDCGVIDAGGNIISTDGSIFVSTSSGNALVVCKAQLPDPATFPDKAIKWTPDNFNIPCGTSLGTTNDFQEVITPSGQIMLVCHYQTPKI
jgi:hypothetical protein